MTPPTAASGEKKQSLFPHAKPHGVSPEPPPKSWLCSPGQICPSASTLLLNRNSLGHEQTDVRI